ncbi:MAG: serine/threonine-protein kinase, partial [Planctomycetota bacterium]
MSKEKEEEVLQKKLLKYKLISEKDLEEGLKAQRVMAELGIQKELRDVLIDKGLISSEQLRAKRLQKSIKYVIEGYTLLKKLGKGSMGVVYKARRNEDEALFAIKILSSHLGQDMNFIKRFLREAKHCIDLEHENIVKAYEVGFSNDRYYFTMEFIEGEDLRKKLNRTGPFQETEILAILTQISRALDYADSINLIHRDIKPDNIIIDPEGVAKLCDLGLAKVGMSDNHSLTQAGMVVGTPFYISPEQCRGKALDIRSDIYSLGATLYHMATGQVPFNASDGIAILAKHVAEIPVSPKKLRPELSVECDAILLRMLAKKPEDRYLPKTLLSEVSNLRQQRKFETTLDMKIGRPLSEGPNTEDTHFDLFEEMETSGDIEDAEKEKSSNLTGPVPSVPHSSILLKRSKPEEMAQKTRAESPTQPKSQKSRKMLLLLIISLFGLSLVLLLILSQIL